MIDIVSANIPIGRILEAAEIADTALFLSRSQSSAITGSNLYVTVGRTRSDLRCGYC
ncbi:SDR family oxidoreductase [Nesterenkonia salmonea]|uniref:SDR family oxidoreductase n=1 Tax=Nesterenkonia salmonea TaxID=1804987 RepID=A0A5R9BEV1_9MICC|nr:SDR family oxidoreductase [Nesterenkonia salmonea]